MSGKELLDQAVSGRGTLLFDGAMGTMLQDAGLKAGSLPDLMCIDAPDAVGAVHKAYVDAGAQVVTTNTFGSTPSRMPEGTTVEAVVAAAVACARAAGAPLVAADIGPLQDMLEPVGSTTKEQAYDAFAEQARAIAKTDADLVIIETMSDINEISAAVEAVRDACDLPVFATMTFTEYGATFMGVTPEAAAQTLAELGVSAVGINCSLGPDLIAPLIERMAAVTDVPLIAQANAGLPQVVDGAFEYPVGPEEFAQQAHGLIDAGATIIGGCCGTNPAYTAGLAAIL